MLVIREWATKFYNVKVKNELLGVVCIYFLLNICCFSAFFDKNVKELMFLGRRM